MTVPLSKSEKGLNNRELGAYRRSVLDRLGFDPDDLHDWRLKWNNFCKFKIVKDIENEITFPLYMAKAKTAGLTSPSDIGQHRGQYQMGRKTDRGPYTKASCRFITVEQNQKERKLNGGTAIAIEKAARVRRGQTKETDEHIESMAKKLSGRTTDSHAYLVEAGKKRGRAFVVYSPRGKKYFGQSLNAFCKEHDLGQASMSLLCRGLRDEYKGWTGSYVEELKPWYNTKESKCKKATSRKETATS